MSIWVPQGVGDAVQAMAPVLTSCAPSFPSAGPHPGQERLYRGKGISAKRSAARGSAAATGWTRCRRRKNLASLHGC